MPPINNQRERLKNKAAQHSDVRENKKANAKKSTGSFNFRGLGDETNTSHSPKKKHVAFQLASAKRFATSRFGVAMITAVAVSSMFMIEDAVANFRTQDNLDATAVGTVQESEPGNNKVFPNPPNPDEDTMRPANVGLPGMKVNPQRSVAVGDSTVAWASGKKVTKSLSGCDVDTRTWSDLIGMKNLSCPGATTQEISNMIKQHADIIKGSDTVFVTAGSNDIRGDKVGDLDNSLEELVKTIGTLNPKAQVVFVGYLPAYIDDACMDIKDRNSARRLYDYHRKANYAMQDAALRHAMHYIDVFHSPFEVCDKDNAYVRIPRHQAPGVVWHTTESGHKKIAADIEKFVDINTIT